MNFNKKLGVFLILAGITPAFGQQATIKTLPPARYAVVLYGEQVTEKTGNNQLMAGHWTNKGGGSFTWKKEFAEAGDYGLAISYSAKAADSKVKVSTGKDSVVADLVATSGYYNPANTDWFAANFERREIPGKLQLVKGINTVALTLSGTAASEINLYAVELIPIAKKTLIAQDLALAAKRKPETRWLANAGYGLMFHWTSQSAPQTGALKPYNDAVNAFDVNSFVNMVQKTGASYVIFTMNHAAPYFPAPLKSWEKEYPGHTTKRDLVTEISDELKKYDIKLVLYLATHVYSKFDEVDDAEFDRLNTTLLSEIGERYKTKVAGYWLDGWYQCFAKHPSFDFEKFYKTTKIGNKDRLLTLNTWIYPAVTMWQDYWCGEVYKMGNPAATPVWENGPAKGLQAQSLIVMEQDDWVHTALNTPIKPPSLNADELASFINKQKGKGPVTINIQIYQDGSISPGALQVMETVNKLVRK